MMTQNQKKDDDREVEVGQDDNGVVEEDEHDD